MRRAWTDIDDRIYISKWNGKLVTSDKGRDEIINGISYRHIITPNQFAVMMSYPEEGINYSLEDDFSLNNHTLECHTDVTYNVYGNGHKISWYCGSERPYLFMMSTNNVCHIEDVSYYGNLSFVNILNGTIENCESDTSQPLVNDKMINNSVIKMCNANWYVRNSIDTNCKIIGCNVDSDSDRKTHYFCETNNGLIETCTIYDKYDYDEEFTRYGFCKTNNGTIKNCTNYEDLWNGSSGICETNNGTIISCINEGYMGPSNNYGMCKNNNGTIIGCINLSDIGYTSYGITKEGTVTACCNSGRVGSGSYAICNSVCTKSCNTGILDEGAIEFINNDTNYTSDVSNWDIPAVCCRYHGTSIVYPLQCNNKNVSATKDENEMTVTGTLQGTVKFTLL